MAELFRFDFSRPVSTDAVVADGQLGKRSSPSRSFFYRPGRSTQSVPPGIRLAFLIAVSLTAGICSYAVSKLATALPKAGASENRLPAGNASSKLKSAANLIPARPAVAEKHGRPPEVRDNGMSLLVQLPPIEVDLPAPPPPPLFEEGAASLLPAPIGVIDPEPIYDPEPVHDPVAVHNPVQVHDPVLVQESKLPGSPPSIDLLPPDPLPSEPPVAEKPKKETPAFELPPAPPEITVEKMPEVNPVVPLPAAAPMAMPKDDDRILVYLDAMHQGDTPMLNTWKQLNLAAVFAAALATSQGAAVAQDDIKTVIEQLKSMDGEIKMAFKTLNADVKSLDDEMKNIKTNMTGLQSSVLNQGKDVDAMNIKVRDLEKTVKQLRFELDDMRQKLPGEIALFAPVTKDSLDEMKNRIRDLELKLAESQSAKRISLAPANTGRIMLVNLYNEDLVFTVNGQTYRVPAGRSTPVDNVPVGTVSYEMISPTWGRRASTQTNLAANETLTLTAQ